MLKLQTELEVNVLRDPGAITRILPAWDQLWDRCSNATTFQRPEWINAWITAFEPQQPFVIAVWRGSQLVGLAPLLIYKRNGHRVLALLGGGVSDYLDILVDPLSAGETLTIIWEQIGNESSNWDAIDFTDLPCTSVLLRGTAPRWHWAIEMQDACPVLTLPADAKTLTSAVPSQQLRNLRNARNRLAKIGGGEIKLASSENFSKFLDEFVKLHHRRWAEDGLPGMMSQPAVQEFHRRVAPRLLEKGILRLYGLLKGGRFIAALYALFEKEVAYYYVQGFDPDWRWFSPGTQILGAVVEDALREGKKKVDFLRGRESYKYQWGTHDEPTFRLSTQHCVPACNESKFPAASEHLGFLP